jgi:hypothetical protein
VKRGQNKARTSAYKVIFRGGFGQTPPSLESRICPPPENPRPTMPFASDGLPAQVAFGRRIIFQKKAPAVQFFPKRASQGKRRCILPDPKHAGGILLTGKFHIIKMEQARLPAINRKETLCARRLIRDGQGFRKTEVGLTK